MNTPVLPTDTIDYVISGIHRLVEAHPAIDHERRWHPTISDRLGDLLLDLCWHALLAENPEDALDRRLPTYSWRPDYRLVTDPTQDDFLQVEAITRGLTRRLRLVDERGHMLTERHDQAAYFIALLRRGLDLQLTGHPISQRHHDLLGLEQHTETWLRPTPTLAPANRE